MYWDGEGWVAETGDPVRSKVRSQKRKLRDRLTTLSLLVLLPALLLFPITATQASTDHKITVSRPSTSSAVLTSGSLMAATTTSPRILSVAVHVRNRGRTHLPPVPTHTPSPRPTPDATRTPAPTSAPTVAPDPTSTPASSPKPSPTPTPTPTPAPAATPSPLPSSSVYVSSVSALLSALADDSVNEIVVENGTYTIPDSSTHQMTGLWIDKRFASRTRPVLIRAETIGGVTFSGGGATAWNALSFRDGVHDQTWQGFRFADATPTQTGVIVFGQNGSLSTAAPYNITLRDIAIDGSITSTNPGSGDHSIYFSQSIGGVHDILIDGMTVDGSGGVNTALTFYSSAPGEPNAWNVTARHVTVTRTRQPFEFWDATLRNIVVEDCTVTGARAYAVRYELGGTVTIERVTSTGSALGGFYSSLGTNPPGVTLLDDNLH